jgi:hypothetical protein
MKKAMRDRHNAPHHGGPPHSASHPRDLFLPIVTLGFYGLRRFRPPWLYTATALLILGAWVGLAFIAATLYPGGEYLLVLPLFIMAVVTFLRLVPTPARHAAHHR